MLSLPRGYGLGSNEMYNPEGSLLPPTASKVRAEGVWLEPDNSLFEYTGCAVEPRAAGTGASAAAATSAETEAEAEPAAGGCAGEGVKRGVCVGVSPTARNDGRSSSDASSDTAGDVVSVGECVGNAALELDADDVVGAGVVGVMKCE